MAPDFNSWNPYPFKYRQPEKGIPIGRNQIRSQGLSSSYPKEQDRNGKRRDPGNEVRVAEPLRIVHYREPPPPPRTQVDRIRVRLVKPALTW